MMHTADPHSVSNIGDFQIDHLKWTCKVDFESKVLHAVAEYRICVGNPDAPELLLDASNLHVRTCAVNGEAAQFGGFKGNFGGGLRVSLPAGAARSGSLVLVIEYSTTDGCSAAQWLSPEQTLGKRHPFLFTQCQAIHARSLLPIQDSPSVKFTYEASVECPAELVALMGAQRDAEGPSSSGPVRRFRFSQPVRIPSYLLALAVGCVEGRAIGPRSTVWAEPEVVEAAAQEFSDTEAFLAGAEEIAGPYVWGIYDLLVLPASFPYGGMENPCLTFLSPSLIAGDKSLVDVVAHEIAHSWTGNLVTNAEWSAFWLNEGFTMFLERRITGRLRGQPYRHFDACLGLTELRRDVVERYGPAHPATALAPDMSQMDPDDAYSRVPYEKGHTFLFYLESVVNEGLDPDELGPFGECLRAYFGRFANQSLTVAEWKDFFLQFFADHHPAIHERLLRTVDFDAWLFGVGMPPVTPDYDQTLCLGCQKLAQLWLSSPQEAAQSKSYSSLTPLQKAYFLDLLFVQESRMSGETLELMERTLELNKTGNVEIALNWFLLVVKNHHEPAYDSVRRFLGQHGRMKYNRPIYQELARGDAKQRQLALQAFQEHAAFYHPIARAMIQKDLAAISTPSQNE